MARIDSFLRLVVDQSASDLHFNAESVPLVRYRGDLLPLPFRKLSNLEARRFLFEIMSEEDKEKIDKNIEVDFVYDLQDAARFRVNVFIQNHGLGAVFRAIPHRVPVMDDMMFPSIVRKLCKLTNGLVLVTGPTGSGKTTTLASMVNEINATSNRHIITIEDPIEFLHEPLRSTVTHRQVGKHVVSFAQALRSSLREAPDVLVLGEMRDVETMSLALTAAETGVLVLGTMHTNSAAKAVTRLIDAMPGENREQARGVLSILLRAILSQRLCKRADGNGRVALLEILLQNFAISNMIRENKIHLLDSYIKSANPRETGMQSIDRSIIQYIRDELVTVEDAIVFAENPQQVLSEISMS